MEPNDLRRRQKKPLSLAIKENQVSVAPGGKVIVHIAIINNGTENDQVALSFKGLPTEWVTLEDPSVYLAAGEIKEVLISIQPPPYPQSDVGEYTMTVQAASTYDPWRTASVNCLVTVAAHETKGRIGIFLGSLQFSVMPDSGITIPLILKNQGVREDVFGISVEGLPGDWVSIPNPLVRLEGGERRQVQFNLRVPRSPQAHAGPIPFKLVVVSQNYAVEKVEVDCVLTVAAFSQFTAALEPQSLQANQPGKLVVRNEGNTADDYQFTFQSPNRELVFEKITRTARKSATSEIVQSEGFRVSPGESGVFEFQGRPRTRELLGGERILPFLARVQSSSQRVADVHGQILVKSVLPSWAVAASVIVVLALCFLALLPSGALNEGAPAIPIETPIGIPTEVPPEVPTEAPVVPPPTVQPTVEEPGQPIESPPPGQGPGIELPDICTSVGSIGALGILGVVLGIRKQKRRF